MKSAQKLEHLPVSTLVPSARNARTHSPAQVDALAKAITRFGFTNPVLIDGEGHIVAGHGRVLAARQLGLSDVPCLRLEWLSDAEKRAYIIADNQLAALSEWDEEILKREVVDLRKQGIDPSEMALDDEFLADLFDPGQMQKSFDRGVLDETQDDEEPEYRNEGRFPVTVILDADEFAAWDALKQRKGLSDKRLLLMLMEGK